MFGGWPNENAHRFLRLTEWQMVTSNVDTPTMKVWYLLLCLEVESPADDWYQKLLATTKTDWDTLEAAFIQEWTPQSAQAMSTMDRTVDLIAHKLKPEDVSRTAPSKGRMEYTHIIWANEMLAKAKVCQLETWVKYVAQVMGDLPIPIRNDLDRSTITDWMTFTNVVKAIDIQRLQDHLTAEKETKEKEDMVQAQLKELTMELARLRVRPAQTLTYQRPNQYQTYCQTTGDNSTSAMTTEGKAPYMPNTARAWQPCPPPTEEEKAKVQKNLSKYPQQPDMNAGQATYRWQMAQWTASRGPTDPVTHATLVPHWPGTAMACTGECFKCGMHGHKEAACQVPQGHLNHLSHEEVCWRVICGTMLGPVNRPTAAQVHMVFSVEGKTADPWSLDESEYQQEKEGGPPA
jgi:hypothetical protein